jgi:hypothetical protein
MAGLIELSERLGVQNGTPKLRISQYTEIRILSGPLLPCEVRFHLLCFDDYRVVLIVSREYVLALSGRRFVNRVQAL